MVVVGARSARATGDQSSARDRTRVRMEDELVCEYDSTWDTESEGDDAADNGARRSSHDRTRRARAGFWSNSSSRNLRAAKDMQNYRHGYPNIIDEECAEERMPNLKFYLNEMKSSPDDVSIETFHSEWRTDYKRLERVHSYIQWLFPLREPGVNYMATELSKKEIQAFRESEEARRRLVDSYELMLGFYGIQLLNRETGEVTRSENWRERFANLERNMHNNLRITRMLKSLGELGFERFQAPLVHFFLEETLVRKNLGSVKRSVLDYFLFAVRDKRERRKLIRYAFQHYEPKDKFVWCPRRVQKRFKKKAEKRLDLSVGNGQPADEGQTPGTSTDAERDDKAVETRKESEDDPMSVDLEKQLEGTSVDPEPNPDGSAVYPAPLEASSSANDGEMDLSGGTESSIAKAQDGSTEENKKAREMVPDRGPADAQMPAPIDADEDPARRAGHDGAQNSRRSPELPGPQDESDAGAETWAAVGSPKHVLPCASPSKRAEKLPRTETAPVPDRLETPGAGVVTHGSKQSEAAALMDGQPSAAGGAGS
ncbi:opioid growth factor receptor [Electrophorus electricus]|uniref:Opioid growth factor receptor (OGFr) conserved domain-containing protein n=1 Tax=Electrophorus electricus TaxID=8005 RepID=A0A4W4FWP1_ELEEL|nr:opioid growth factor receptor [Electrophorus electricus]